jgi:hypothetical protein
MKFFLSFGIVNKGRKRLQQNKKMRVGKDTLHVKGDEMRETDEGKKYCEAIVLIPALIKPLLTVRRRTIRPARDSPELSHLTGLLAHFRAILLVPWAISRPHLPCWRVAQKRACQLPHPWRCARVKLTVNFGKMAA